MDTAGGETLDVPGAVRGGAVEARPALADELMVVLPAVAASASLVRERVRRWLEGLRWPPADADDVVMAANEAVANVIDHAYLGRAQGAVHVHAWPVRRPNGRRVVVAVMDRGRWRRFRADRGYRGHGVPMMVACMESVQIDHAEGGTTVVMASATVPDRAEG